LKGINYKGAVKMKQHVTIISILYIGMGVIGLVIACLLFSIFVFSGSIVYSAEGDPFVLSILGPIGLCLAGFISLLAIPDLIGGIGLMRYKNWARILVMILSVLNLFNVPIGTAIGVYSLWALIQGDTEALFINGGPPETEAELIEEPIDESMIDE
jgi:hypothetical protein